MGRLPNSGRLSRIKQPHFEDKRQRHRNADSKYRSKVQYLYFKIRSLLKKKTAKDGLLDNALGFIHHLEHKIYEALGSDSMESCRKEFLSFLEKEEALWKKEKDVTKWWSNVEDLLIKNQPLDLKANELSIAIASEVVNKINDWDQHAKSSKPPYRRSLISSKKQKNKYFKCMRCSGNECGSVSFNEEFQKEVDTCDEEENLFSALWNAPEVPHFNPVAIENSKGVNDSTSLNRKKIFNTEDSLGVSRIPISIKNYMVDALDHTKSHAFYLGRSYVEL